MGNSSSSSSSPRKPTTKPVMSLQVCKISDVIAIVNDQNPTLYVLRKNVFSACVDKSLMDEGYDPDLPSGCVSIDSYNIQVVDSIILPSDEVESVNLSQIWRWDPLAVNIAAMRTPEHKFSVFPKTKEPWTLLIMYLLSESEGKYLWYWGFLEQLPEGLKPWKLSNGFQTAEDLFDNYKHDFNKIVEDKKIGATFSA